MNDEQFIDTGKVFHGNKIWLSAQGTIEENNRLKEMFIKWVDRVSLPIIDTKKLEK